MDIHCGTVTIPGLMTDEYGMKDHQRIDYNVPFWEWPESKSLLDCLFTRLTRRFSPQESWVGRLLYPEVTMLMFRLAMKHDAQEMPDVRPPLSHRQTLISQTLGALIMHGAKLTPEEYQPIKQGFLECIGKEGAYTVSLFLHLPTRHRLTS